MTGQKTKIILLDLGGVLLRLHDSLDAFGLDMHHDEFLEKWLLSGAVRKLERGAMATTDFAAELVQEFALPYSPQEFLRRFNEWPDALFDGVPELLKKLGDHYHVALLSNTNAIHWERQDIEGRLEPLFHSLFLSYRTGLVKPEGAAFEDVLNSLDTSAGEVLFLDDNQLNIDAAIRCGMQARLTRGVQNLTDNLRRAGITF